MPFNTANKADFLAKKITQEQAKDNYFGLGGVLDLAEEWQEIAPDDKKIIWSFMAKWYFEAYGLAEAENLSANSFSERLFWYFRLHHSLRKARKYLKLMAKRSPYSAWTAGDLFLAGKIAHRSKRYKDAFWLLSQALAKVDYQKGSDDSKVMWAHILVRLASVRIALGMAGLALKDMGDVEAELLEFKSIDKVDILRLLAEALYNLDMRGEAGMRVKQAHDEARLAGLPSDKPRRLVWLVAWAKKRALHKSA